MAQIQFNIRDEFVNACCDAFDYSKNKGTDETKPDFVARMAKRWAKDMGKAYLIRTASEAAVVQTQVTLGAIDD